LRDEFGVAQVVTRVKSNFSAPADPHIAAESRVGTPLSPGSALRQLLVVQFGMTRDCRTPERSCARRNDERSSALRN